MSGRHRLPVFVDIENHLKQHGHGRTISKDDVCSLDDIRLLHRQEEAARALNAPPFIPLSGLTLDPGHNPGLNHPFQPRPNPGHPFQPPTCTPGHRGSCTAPPPLVRRRLAGEPRPISSSRVQPSHLPPLVPAPGAPLPALGAAHLPPPPAAHGPGFFPDFPGRLPQHPVLATVPGGPGQAPGVWLLTPVIVVQPEGHPDYLVPPPPPPPSPVSGSQWF